MSTVVHILKSLQSKSLAYNRHQWTLRPKYSSHQYNQIDLHTDCENWSDSIEGVLLINCFNSKLLNKQQKRYITCRIQDNSMLSTANKVGESEKKTFPSISRQNRKSST